MDSAQLARLLKMKFVAVSGKGGVGKSTLTAALVRRAAACGQRVLAAETAECPQLGPLLGASPGLRHTEQDLGDGVRYIHIDSRQCFREYVTEILGLRRLYNTVLKRGVVRSFLDALPGLSQAMLLGRFYYSVQLQQHYDIVLFDAPASGHFFELLTTPRAIARSGVVGPLAREIAHVESFLAQPTSACLYVITPEPLVVSEALDFIPKIQRDTPLSLAAAWLNRVQPEFAGPTPAFATAAPVIRDWEQRERRAHGELREGLSALVAAPPLWLSPDLGPLADPLTAAAADGLLAGVRGV